MRGCRVTLGQADRQGDLLDDVTRFCDEALPESSIYAVLYRERDRLFPDEMFADLFSDKGRRSVPPSVVATVMVLQRLDGLSGPGGGGALHVRRAVAVRGPSWWL